MRLAYPAHSIPRIALEGALERQQRALWLAEIAKCVGACAPGQRTTRIEGDGATSGDERFTVAIHLMEGDAASGPGAGVPWKERDGAIVNTQRIWKLSQLIVGVTKGEPCRVKFRVELRRLFQSHLGMRGLLLEEQRLALNQEVEGSGSSEIR